MSVRNHRRRNYAPIDHSDQRDRARPDGVDCAECNPAACQRSDPDPDPHSGPVDRAQRPH